MGRFAALMALILFVSASLAGQPAAARVAEWRADFRSEGSEAAWAIQGKIEARRTPLAGSAGHAVHLKGEAGGYFASRVGLAPASWRDHEALEFSVWRPPNAAATPLTLEVLAFEAAPQLYFVQRVQLDETGWRRITLPLRWFRPGKVGVPSWSRISRFAIAFRTPGEFWLEQVRLIPGRGPGVSEPTLAQMAALAFPRMPAEQLKMADRPCLRLLSDAPLDEQALAAHLEKVNVAVYRKLPFLAKPESPPWLLIFASEADYRGFPARLADRFGATAARPASAGYTLLGFALSYWDPAKGSVRSVYTHEYVHSLLEKSARLANRADWAQEGLATLLQAEFHPDFNLPAQARLRMAKAKPLAELCAGQPLRLEDYWQAATLWECLLDHPRHKLKLGDLLARLRTAENANLGPHLRPVIGADWGELTIAWKLHCKNHYGVD